MILKSVSSHRVYVSVILIFLCVVYFTLKVFGKEDELFAVNLFNSIYFGEVLDGVPDEYEEFTADLLEKMKDVKEDADFLEKIDELSIEDYRNLPVQCFVPDEQYDQSFLIFGKTYNDQFLGICMVLELSDGVKTYVTFDDEGRIKGKTRYEFPDGSYSTVPTLNGVFYGYLLENDSEGIRYNKDWYYKGTLVKEWKAEAKEISCQELQEKENEYLMKPVILNGIVKEVQATANEIIYLIEDDNKEIFFVKYPDKEKKLFLIPEAPFLEKGEIVRVCGIFRGLKDYTDFSLLSAVEGWNISDESVCEGITNADVIREVSKWSLSKQISEEENEIEQIPVIDTVSITVDGDETDNLHLTNEYTEVVLHPTEYWNRPKELVGNVIFQTEDLQKIVLKTDEEELYMVTCKKEILDAVEGNRVRYKGKTYGLGRFPYFDLQNRIAGYLFLPEVLLTKYKEYSIE